MYSWCSGNQSANVTNTAYNAQTQQTNSVYQSYFNRNAENSGMNLWSSQGTMYSNPNAILRTGVELTHENITRAGKDAYLASGGFGALFFG